MKPGDPAILAACGQFYASQKRWPEARRDLSAAIAAAPKVPIYKHQLAVVETRSGDINAGLAVFNQLVGPEKAHYNVAFLLAQEGKQEAAAQECRASLSINPKFEPARAMLDQMQNHQVAGDPRGSEPAPCPLSGPVNAAPPSNGFAPVAMGNSNQPAAARPRPLGKQVRRPRMVSALRTRAVGTFDPALPKASRRRPVGRILERSLGDDSGAPQVARAC